MTTIRKTKSTASDYTNVALEKKVHKRLRAYSKLHGMHVGKFVTRAVVAALDSVGAK